MVKINNDIDKDISCDVYHLDKKIGTCNSALSFYDVLCQIKDTQESGYSFIVKCKLPNGDIRECKCEITKDGRIHPASMKNVKLWNTILEEQLLFLHGYKEKVVYSEKAPIPSYV